VNTWWVCPQCDTVWRAVGDDDEPAPGYDECRRIALDGGHYAVCRDCE
jgi:hypothetical protein